LISHKIGRFFTAHEMRCRGWELRDQGRQCGCRGAAKWDPELIALADQIRGLVYRAPAIVLNGFRCELYNRSVDGYPSSYHMDGAAMDLRFLDGVDGLGKEIEAAAHNMGDIAADFLPPGRGNVLWYPDRHFIHLDTGPTNRKIVRKK